jgi:hypothetical protein
MRKQFVPKADKAARAQAIRGYIAMNGLHVPTKAAWYPAFAQESLSFPVSKTDDQVDALSIIGQMLEIMVPPKLAPYAGGRRIMQPSDFRDYAVASDQIDDRNSDNVKML